MKRNSLIFFAFFYSFFIAQGIQAQDTQQLQQEIDSLTKQTQQLKRRVDHLTHQTHKKTESSHKNYHDSVVIVHALNDNPGSVEFNPAALIADDHVVTYIAGMPIVSSPYLGARPAFDGSDYLVNISSINRDIRLMQQRRRLFNSFDAMGYSRPNLPILALSGKVQPMGTIGQSYMGATTGDLNLGSNEFDIAAAVNDDVEAYMAISYVLVSSNVIAQRVTNAVLNLNMGFINIGNLDKTPFYFTAGQLFAPFGRYSSSMITPPLTMILSRTKTFPVILGYKSQQDTGFFAAIYAFKGDTTLGSTGVGGANLGYVYNINPIHGEVGVSYISSMNSAGGMQITGSPPKTMPNFGGFGAILNGNENVKKIPAIDVHGILAFGPYSLTAEWVSSIGTFREQDLSFNGYGAQPQAAQLEGGRTFFSFDKPSSVSASAQWSQDTLALNYPITGLMRFTTFRFGKILLKALNTVMTLILEPINLPTVLPPPVW